MQNADSIINQIKDIDLKQAIIFTKKYLLKQGPVFRFVHHNTLHQFETLNFHDALRNAATLYKANTYLSEKQFKKLLKTKKINISDIQASLNLFYEETFFSINNRKISNYDFLFSILINDNYEQFKLSKKNGHSLSSRSGQKKQEQQIQILFSHLKKFNNLKIDKINLIDEIQLDTTEYKSVLLEKANVDIDEWVTFYLGRFLEAYFDLGQATWPIIYKETWLKTFINLYGRNDILSKRWKRNFQRELLDIDCDNVEDEILKQLKILNIKKEHYTSFIFDLALRQNGWCDLILYYEKYPQRSIRSEIKANFLEYLLVRIMLEKHFVIHFYKQNNLPLELNIKKYNSAVNIEELLITTSYHMVNLGFNPKDFPINIESTKENLSQILNLINNFDKYNRSKIWQEAYENNYVDKFINAIAFKKSHLSTLNTSFERDTNYFQIITCIDDREESLRRHLEELDHNVLTYGYVGNFGVNIFFKALHSPRYISHGNSSNDPQIYIDEIIINNKNNENFIILFIFHFFSKIKFHLTFRSISLIDSILTLCSGFFLVIPLILKIFFPFLDLKIKHFIKNLLENKIITDLKISKDGVNLDIKQQAIIVKDMLETTGIDKFSSVIFLTGHGSTTLNNPHSAAYNCGACGGENGKPNARLVANFGNKKEVRQYLEKYNIIIPESTIFVASFHNTCSDEFTIFDLYKYSSEQQKNILIFHKIVQQACMNTAHERCRKFKNIEHFKNLSSKQAFNHVLERSNNIYQPRAEYGHMTNSLCIIGDRNLTSGLFLDRRAFLISYDYKQDSDGSILTKFIASNLNVCIGINLEYYFSHIDNIVFGAGTKLSHNITSLQAVVNGSGSDLLLGLPYQMVDIHQPMRIVTLIEVPLAIIKSVIQTFKEDTNNAFYNAINNEWLKLIILNPKDQSFYIWRNSKFNKININKIPIHCHSSSYEVYKNKRECLDISYIFN